MRSKVNIGNVTVDRTNESFWTGVLSMIDFAGDQRTRVIDIRRGSPRDDSMALRRDLAKVGQDLRAAAEKYAR